MAAWTSDVAGSGAHGAAGGWLFALFFALLTPPSIAHALARRIERYRSHLRLTGTPTPPALLHISLNGLGVFRRPDEQIIARAREAAGRVAASRFVVKLDRLISWKGSPRPLVLTGDDGVVGVRRLHRTIHAALADAGLASRAVREFEPHLTLLRDRAEPRPQWVSPVSWEVREFVLLHSLRGRGRHDVLGRWPLLG